MANKIFATSNAGKMLRKANINNGLEPVSEYLTVHTVGVDDMGPQQQIRPLA